MMFWHSIEVVVFRPSVERSRGNVELWEVNMLRQQESSSVERATEERIKFIYIILKAQFLPYRERSSVSTSKKSQIMPFSEIISVHRQNLGKQVNAL
jgi:hypothetical protein